LRNLADGPRGEQNTVQAVVTLALLCRRGLLLWRPFGRGRRRSFSRWWIARRRAARRRTARRGTRSRCGRRFFLLCASAGRGFRGTGGRGLRSLGSGPGCCGGALPRCFARVAGVARGHELGGEDVVQLGPDLIELSLYLLDGVPGVSELLVRGQSFAVGAVLVDGDGNVRGGAPSRRCTSRWCSSSAPTAAT